MSTLKRRESGLWCDYCKELINKNVVSCEMLLKNIGDENFYQCQSILCTNEECLENHDHRNYKVKIEPNSKTI